MIWIKETPDDVSILLKHKDEFFAGRIMLYGQWSPWRGKAINPKSELYDRRRNIARMALARSAKDTIVVLGLKEEDPTPPGLENSQFLTRIDPALGQDITILYCEVPPEAVEDYLKATGWSAQ